MSRSTWLIAAILAVSFLLSACGQKGELYLPDEDKQEQKKRY
jgi:predicted small lipoprotein YifL